MCYVIQALVGSVMQAPGGVMQALVVNYAREEAPLGGRVAWTKNPKL